MLITWPSLMNVAPSADMVTRSVQPRSLASARGRASPQTNKKMPSRATPYVSPAIESTISRNKKWTKLPGHRSTSNMVPERERACDGRAHDRHGRRAVAWAWGLRYHRP